MNSSLFLGFPLTQTYKEEMAKQNKEYLDLFIQKNSDYLEELEWNGVSYLGKFVQEELAISQLELLESNIYSILKKIVLVYSYKTSPLFLFAYPKTST